MGMCTVCSGAVRLVGGAVWCGKGLPGIGTAAVGQAPVGTGASCSTKDNLLGIRQGGRELLGVVDRLRQRAGETEGATRGEGMGRCGAKALLRSQTAGRRCMHNNKRASNRASKRSGAEQERHARGAIQKGMWLRRGRGRSGSGIGTMWNDSAAGRHAGASSTGMWVLRGFLKGKRGMGRIGSGPGGPKKAASKVGKVASSRPSWRGRVMQCTAAGIRQRMKREKCAEAQAGCVISAWLLLARAESAN